jgi:hypothetical protein
LRWLCIFAPIFLFFFTFIYLYLPLAAFICLYLPLFAFIGEGSKRGFGGLFGRPARAAWAGCGFRRRLRLWRTGCRRGN